MDEKEFLRKVEQDYEETKFMTKMTTKVIDLLHGKIVVSNEEIDELINFFQKDEYYVLCGRLKKLKK